MLLHEELTFQKRLQLSGDAKDSIYQENRLYRVLDDSTLLIPAGLTARVCNALREAGHTVKITDLRNEILPEPCYENLDPLRPGQDKVVEAIIVNDGGVIEAPTSFGKSFVIRQLAKLWPTARMIICTYSKDIVRQFYSELLEFLPHGQVGLVGDGRNEYGKRVVCAVDKSLAKCDLDKCQLFVFDEVHRAAAAGVSETIARIRNARMYGLSASPYGRGDKADKLTEAMFGPLIFKLSYQEAQANKSVVPVQVRFVSTAGCTSQEFKMTVAMERNCLWRNKERNQVIANAVGAIIQELGPDAQVLITVSKVEHAVHLGSKLPQFALVYGSMNPVDRKRWERDNLIPANVHPLTSGRREQMRLAFREGSLKYVIATGVWSTGVDFPGLNVLVRADAAGGPIANTQLPGRVTRTTEGKECGIVLDFDDKFNKILANRAEQRAKHYRRKGWQVIMPPTPAYMSQ